MEWLPMCEELEKAVGGRNWLDMMIGNKEWQLRDLGKEAREMAFEIEVFLLKLMDEEPSHRRVFGGDEGQRGSVNLADWEPMFILHCQREINEDLRLASEINALCARVIAIVDERENFNDELDMLAGRYVNVRMAMVPGMFWSLLGDSSVAVAELVANEVIDYEFACSFSRGRGVMELEELFFANNVDYLNSIPALFSLTFVISASHVKRIPCKGDVQLLIHVIVILKFLDIFCPNLEACGVLL
nr:hypothetical protein [Tanacetum cinerariifolium]